MANIGYFLLSLAMFGLLVFVHELGHFLAARATGIGVKAFALGFGPKLLEWRGKDTSYSLRLVPMGGFCRFYGEGEESDREDAFNRQSVWKRMVTVAAGPFMNFVLAYAAVVVFLLSGAFLQSVPLVQEVAAGSGAQKAGMLAGDVVIEVAGQPISYDVEGVSRMIELIQEAPEEVPVAVERGGERLDMSVMTHRQEGRGLIGITMAAEEYRYSPGRALLQGVTGLGQVMREMLNMLGRMFSTGEGLDQTAGPVGMLTIMTETVRQGFDMALNLIVLLSLNLGIINLLPIPALDGGHLVLLLVEAVRRKPIPRELEGWIQAGGFALIIGIFILVTYRDILRLIGG